MKQEDTLRFSRHFLIPGWGLTEQDRLLRAKVCLATSLPFSATYLVAAGVRSLCILKSTTGDMLPPEAVFRQHLLGFEPALCLDLIEPQSVDLEQFDLVIEDDKHPLCVSSNVKTSACDAIQIREQPFEARCNWLAGDRAAVTAASRLLLDSSIAMIAISRLLMNSGAN